MRCKCVIHIVVKSRTQFYEAFLIWLLWALPAFSLSFPTLLSPSFSATALLTFLLLVSKPPCSLAFQDLCLESLSLVLCWVTLQPCHYFLPEAFWLPSPGAQILQRLQELLLGKSLLSFQGWPN